MPSKPIAYHTYQALADAYSEIAPDKEYNAYYDRPAMLSLLDEDLAGQHILDAGCGPGIYSEILLKRGAEVTGIDVSENMIQHARTRNGGQGRFPNHCTLSGRFTNSPCRCQRNASRQVTIVASVTTMDGNRNPATSAPLTAPISAPMAIEAGNTNAKGHFIAASNPAHTLHTANCEPTEMSICRQMMTSAMPQATTSVGASRVSNESSGCG